MLVYSISSRLSFTRIQKYHDYIQRVKESSASLVPVMLVGNKSDRVTERAVSTQEGHALARELGCEFVEASAKDDINVEKAFYDVVRLLRRQRRLGRTGTGNDNLDHRDPHRSRGCWKCVTL